MGLVLLVNKEELDLLLKELDELGWKRVNRPYYREKIVKDKWIWFGDFKENKYIFSSYPLEDDENLSILHREGVKELEKEVKEIADRLKLKGLYGGFYEG